jgi:3-oxoacyl-[acyl-carrier protein] reductase
VAGRDDLAVSDAMNVAYVTGASRGIGRHLALYLARSGVATAAMARPSDDLDALAGEHRRLVTTAADVTDPQSVRAAFNAAADLVGPPTILVTCAGSIDALGPLSDVDPDRWWSAVAVDLRGTMLTTQAALHSMLPARQGRIVTIYGNLGDHGLANVSAFAVAKAGVARFTETLASELAGTGVVAIGLHPGFVRTPMTERLAWSEEGRRWLPGFGDHAEKTWGDGAGATQMLDQVVAGAADRLAGRILHPDDNLEELRKSADGNPDIRRLRLLDPDRQGGGRRSAVPAPLSSPAK